MTISSESTSLLPFGSSDDEDRAGAVEGGCSRDFFDGGSWLLLEVVLSAFLLSEREERTSSFTVTDLLLLLAFAFAAAAALASLVLPGRFIPGGSGHTKGSVLCAPLLLDGAAGAGDCEGLLRWGAEEDAAATAAGGRSKGSKSPISYSLVAGLNLVLLRPAVAMSTDSTSCSISRLLM